MRRFFFNCLFSALFIASSLAFALAQAQGAAMPGDQERQDYTMGTGHSNGGFSGTWTDPDTGDQMTTVIAPRPKNQQEQPWPPIYIYPQVAPTWPPQPGPVPRTSRVPGASTQERWPSPFQQNR